MDKREMIKLSPSMVHQGSLQLINREYPFWDTLDKKKLVMVEPPGCNLDGQTAVMLYHLLGKLRSRGAIRLVSGYRSLKEQKLIYQEAVCDKGQTYADCFVAPPGYSEHHSGLALDLEGSGPLFEAFCFQAPKYGFIQRYPRGKEHITGYQEESWHFRYVGFPHSMIMTQNRMTLEEYLVFLRQFSPERPLRFFHKEQQAEIFFLPVYGEEKMELMQHIAYQISGNNHDGVIATVWKIAATPVLCRCAAKAQ